MFINGSSNNIIISDDDSKIILLSILESSTNIISSSNSYETKVIFKNKTNYKIQIYSQNLFAKPYPLITLEKNSEAFADYPVNSNIYIIGYLQNKELNDYSVIFYDEETKNSFYSTIKNGRFYSLSELVNIKNNTVFDIIAIRNVTNVTFNNKSQYDLIVYSSIDDKVIYGYAIEVPANTPVTRSYPIDTKLYFYALIKDLEYSNYDITFVKDEISNTLIVRDRTIQKLNVETILNNDINYNYTISVVNIPEPYIILQNLSGYTISLKIFSISYSSGLFRNKIYRAVAKDLSLSNKGIVSYFLQSGIEYFFEVEITTHQRYISNFIDEKHSIKLNGSTYDREVIAGNVYSERQINPISFSPNTTYKFGISITFIN